MHDLVEWITKCKAVFPNYFLSISNFIQIFKGHPKFCLFANEKLPKLKNKQYSDYQFKPGEWEILGSIQEVLAVCDSI